MKEEKVRTSFYFNRQELIKFKVYCVLNNTSMANVFAKHMRDLTGFSHEAETKKKNVTLD
jgi:hypothetical protein